MIDLPSPSNITYPLSSSERENTSLIFALVLLPSLFTLFRYIRALQFVSLHPLPIWVFFWYSFTQLLPLLLLFTLQYYGITCINKTCTFIFAYQNTNIPVIHKWLEKKNPIQKQWSPSRRYHFSWTERQPLPYMGQVIKDGETAGKVREEICTN